MKKLLYVGIDVDDKSFHGAGFCQETGEILEFACKPQNGALLKKLQKLEKNNFQLKVCYEATYLGYGLQRFLSKNNIECVIIAPSLIPELASDRIKNDRLDSRKLARYFAKDMLTEIYIPNEEDEQIRDLVRSRSFLVK